MPRTPLYPWSAEDTKMGDTYFVDRATFHDAYKAQKAAYAHARSHGYQVQTSVIEISRPGVDAPPRYRIAAHFVPGDREFTRLPNLFRDDDLSLRTKAAGSALRLLYACPECGAESRSGRCPTEGCVHAKTWQCAACQQPIERFTAADQVRSGFQALTDEERLAVLEELKRHVQEDQDATA